MVTSISRDLLILITLLLVSTRNGDSVKMKVDQGLSDSLDPGALSLPVESESPYWEYILREYLFKTISPPPPANNVLYKELLEAPFYTGPFPASSSGTLNDGETAELLSRGDVYHLAKGGWIICQDGCVDCEICRVQKSLTIPAVKWIMKRMKGKAPFPHQKKYDQLQLTVFPQDDNSFHMKNLSPGSYVYVTSNNEALDSFTDTLIRQTKEYNSMQYPFGTTKSTESKNPDEVYPVFKYESRILDQKNIPTELPTGIENEVLPTDSHRYPLGTTKSTESKNPDEVLPVFKNESQILDQKDIPTEVPTGIENEVLSTNSQPRMTPTLVPEMQNSSLGGKRGREILRDELDPDADGKLDHQELEATENPMTVFHPPTVPIVQFIEDHQHADCERGKDTRLILGRDQFGEKQLVHIVPAGKLDTGITRTRVYPVARVVYHETGNSHPLQIYSEDRSLYRKIFRRVIDSLNTHRNAIEKFLLSPKRDTNFGYEESPRNPTGTFYNKDGKPALKNDKDNIMQTFIAQNDDESNAADERGNDSNPLTDNSGEIIEHSEETSLSTTMNVLNGGNNASTEYYDVTVQETEDQTEQDQNVHVNNFDDQNSEADLSDESMKQQNNTASLILKEVAKSVVNQRGFKLDANNSLLHDRESDDSLRTIFDGFLGNTEIYTHRKEKSRRNV